MGLACDAHVEADLQDLHVAAALDVQNLVLDLAEERLARVHADHVLHLRLHQLLRLLVPKARVLDAVVLGRELVAERLGLAALPAQLTCENASFWTELSTFPSCRANRLLLS